MAYGSRDDVKSRLGIGTRSDLNDKIDEYLDMASEDVDNILRPYVSVPLGSVPTVIDKATNDMAVGIYREDQAGMKNRNMSVTTDPAYKRGEKAVKAYAKGTYEKAGPGKGREGLFRKVNYRDGERTHANGRPGGP